MKWDTRSLLRDIFPLRNEARRIKGRLEAKTAFLAKRFKELEDVTDFSEEEIRESIAEEGDEREKREIMAMPIEEPAEKHQVIMDVIKDIQENFEGKAPIEKVAEESVQNGLTREFAEQLINLEIEAGRITPVDVKSFKGSVRLAEDQAD